MGRRLGSTDTWTAVAPENGDYSDAGRLDATNELPPACPIPTATAERSDILSYRESPLA
jgi:hypothetical protein